MLKIFTTQLIGVFNDIQKKNEIEIEDCARLLSQTIISDGHIYVHGFGGLQAVVNEATVGENALPKSDILLKDNGIQQVTERDCIIVLTSADQDEEAVAIVKKVKMTGCAVVGISGSDHHSPSPFHEAVDLHLSHCAKGSLVPLENGKKIGQPLLLAALYTYQMIYLTTMDILDEQDFLRKL